MGIKRGVSLYSYQQTQFFGKMSWKDQIREVREGLGCDGIEIIDETVIRDYPFPSEQFIFDWNNEIARYNMNCVTMDVYMDVHQFRDHIMNHREAAERLKNDIRLAARMGFANVRCLCLVPIEVIEMALPTAEHYNIRIGKEIHAPLPIKPGSSTSLTGTMMDGRMVDQVVDLVGRTGTKHLGLVPDFGIFQHSPTQVAIDYYKRKMDPAIIDSVLKMSAEGQTKDAALKWLNKNHPGHIFNFMTVGSLVFENGSSAKPEDIKEIVPYIVSIHGKFYNMTEIPGQPGCYEDLAIDYATPIKYLRESGFEGYINSEFEGQRHQQDMGIAGLIDERDQVRRHHEMLKRLTGE